MGALDADHLEHPKQRSVSRGKLDTAQRFVSLCQGAQLLRHARQGRCALRIAEAKRWQACSQLTCSADQSCSRVIGTRQSCKQRATRESLRDVLTADRWIAPSGQQRKTCAQPLPQLLLFDLLIRLGRWPLVGRRCRVEGSPPSLKARSGEVTVDLGRGLDRRQGGADPFLWRDPAGALLRRGPRLEQPLRIELRVKRPISDRWSQLFVAPEISDTLVSAVIQPSNTLAVESRIAL